MKIAGTEGQETPNATTELHAPLPFDKHLPLCRTAERFYLVGPAGSAETLVRRAKEAGQPPCKECCSILTAGARGLEEG